MDALPDVPVVVLVATALAAILVLVEAALPTFGVAGTAALGFATIAVLGTGGRLTTRPRGPAPSACFVAGMRRGGIRAG